MNNSTVQVALDRIEVGERLRPVDGDSVAFLAQSMAEDGLRTPITVAAAGADGMYRLIAGGHRVAAAQSLGWDRIAAFIFEGDELQAQLVEIDENLIRRELSPLDRAVFLAKRQEIYQALNPLTKRGKGRAKDKTTSLSFCALTFAKATAAKLGLDERTIQRATARAKIDPAVRAQIAGHRVAQSGTELDKLAAQPVLMQVKIARLLTSADAPCRTVSKALAEISGPSPESRQALANRQFAALLSAWRKAGRSARQQFREHLLTEDVAATIKAGGEP